MIALAANLRDVPVGVASFTDRVLPAMFPTADRAAFDSTVSSLTIEDPPPRDVNTVATTFGALTSLATQGFFPDSVHKRAVVLLTDGESRPFDPAAVAATLRTHGIQLVVVPVGDGADRVWRPGGRPEAGYRADPGLARLDVARLRAALGEGPASDAAAAVRQALGSGPERTVGTASRTRSLAAVAAAWRAAAPCVALALRGESRAEPRPCRYISPGSHRNTEGIGMRNALLAAVGLSVLFLQGAVAATPLAGDWTGFGRTNDSMRHSPLTQISKSNIDQLGRAYTIDLHQLDPDTRARRAVLPARDQRHPLRDDERRTGLRDQRGHRQGALALQAR